MAQRHVQYGVNEMHYQTVGAALLWTLQKGLGKGWHTELEEAWACCYASLSSAMVAASKEVEMV